MIIPVLLILAAAPLLTQAAKPAHNLTESQERDIGWAELCSKRWSFKPAKSMYYLYKAWGEAHAQGMTYERFIEILRTGPGKTNGEALTNFFLEFDRPDVELIAKADQYLKENNLEMCRHTLDILLGNKKRQGFSCALALDFLESQSPELFTFYTKALGLINRSYNTDVRAWEKSGSLPRQFYIDELHNTFKQYVILGADENFRIPFEISPRCLRYPILFFLTETPDHLKYQAAQFYASFYPMQSTRDAIMKRFREGTAKEFMHSIGMDITSKRSRADRAALLERLKQPNVSVKPPASFMKKYKSHTSTSHKKKDASTP